MTDQAGRALVTPAARAASSKQWEEALQALRKCEEDYRRHLAQAPPFLSQAEREAICTLAADIPGLWHASTTTWAQRKEIVRLLIDRVVVMVLGKSERVRVSVFWAGGYETHGEIIRPVKCMEQLSYLKELLDRVQSLRKEGHSSSEIAERLNEEQWRPAKRENNFTAGMVRQMLSRRGLTHRRLKRKLIPELAPDEWVAEDLARELSISTSTLYHWVHKGWIPARLAQGKAKRWIIHAGPAEISQLREQKADPRNVTRLNGRGAKV